MMQKSEFQDHQKQLYKWRFFIDKERIKTSNYLDKYLLTFATGVLALSVTFTGSKSNNLIEKDFLALGWGLLLVSIIILLLSIFFSEKAFKKEIQITDYEIMNGKESKDLNLWNGLVSFLTLQGIIIFASGMICISIFYFINL